MPPDVTCKGELKKRVFWPKAWTYYNPQTLTEISMHARTVLGEFKTPSRQAKGSLGNRAIAGMQGPPKLSHSHKYYSRVCNT